MRPAFFALDLRSTLLLEPAAEPASASEATAIEPGAVVSVLEDDDDSGVSWVSPVHSGPVSSLALGEGRSGTGAVGGASSASLRVLAISCASVVGAPRVRLAL